jgi:hypothetical protein
VDKTILVELVTDGPKFGTRENNKKHNRYLKPKFWDETEQKLKFTAAYCSNNTPTNESQY